MRTDKLSGPFPILRGTKQGDALSTLLFNAVLNDLMRDVPDTWNQRRYGLQLGLAGSSRTLLSNLRFADDLTSDKGAGLSWVCFR